MEKSLERGEMLEGVLLLIALFCIIVFFILPHKGVVGPENSFQAVTQKRPQSYNPNPNAPTDLPTDSSYTKTIKLEGGNARYSFDPIDEYITLRNVGQDPVNISGWKLINGKGNRTYYNGNQVVHYASDEVIVPQAAGYISPQGINISQNVVLKPGEQALLNTGSFGVTSPYKVVSFKENKCSGYLVELNYNFTPTLSRICPRPAEEAGFRNLDTECKDYINRLSTCSSPKFNATNDTLSSQCKAFIEERFNYSGCIAMHKNDPDFYMNTWRLFLGRKWELWATENEQIKLYDQFDKLVDYIAY